SPHHPRSQHHTNDDSPRHNTTRWKPPERLRLVAARQAGGPDRRPLARPKSATGTLHSREFLLGIALALGRSADPLLPSRRRTVPSRTMWFTHRSPVFPSVGDAGADTAIVFRLVPPSAFSPITPICQLAPVMRCHPVKRCGLCPRKRQPVDSLRPE